MERKALLAVLVALAGCTTKGDFKGKLIDPLTGKARAEVEMVARSPTTPNLDCMEITGTTGADGSFVLDGLCFGSSYTLETREPLLVLKGVDSIEGGVESTEVKEIHGYRAPSRSGVYTLEDDELTQQQSIADRGSAKIWNTEVDVHYPVTLPRKLVNLGEDAWLLLAGTRYLKRMELAPLIESGRRRLGSRSAPENSEPWWYIGVEFESDTEYQRKKAEYDKAKVKQVNTDDLNYRYIRGDALPDGHYVLWSEKEGRMWMFNFGEPMKAPGAPEEE